MRKPTTNHRQLTPDLVYGSRMLTKIINSCMKDGKKTAAQKQVYGCLDVIKKEAKVDDPVVFLEQALDNIKPKVEIRPRRIGGAVYQVPTPVRGNRQESLAVRWLISAARQRPSKQYHSFAQKLAVEIMAASKSEGNAITKRLEVERMAEANKAFAHLRW